MEARIAAKNILLRTKNIQPKQCETYELVEIIRTFHQYRYRGMTGHGQDRDVQLYDLEREIAKTISRAQDVSVTELITSYHPMSTKSENCDDPIITINDHLGERLRGLLEFQTLQQLLNFFRETEHWMVRCLIAQEIASRPEEFFETLRLFKKVRQKDVGMAEAIQTYILDARHERNKPAYTTTELLQFHWESIDDGGTFCGVPLERFNIEEVKQISQEPFKTKP